MHADPAHWFNEMDVVDDKAAHFGGLLARALV
jgi:hypothetical protein